MSWISQFLIYWLVYFVLTKSSILTQPENNAADRQIFMIIVITNKGCSQSFLLNPACSCSQRCLRVHSDNICTTEPEKGTYSLHCKCVSDLSKYCVHLLRKDGLDPVRGGYLAIFMSASLTSTAPLYCSSILFVFLCI